MIICLFKAGHAGHVSMQSCRLYKTARHSILITNNDKQSAIRVLASVCVCLCLCACVCGAAFACECVCVCARARWQSDLFFRPSVCNTGNSQQQTTKRKRQKTNCYPAVWQHCTPSPFHPHNEKFLSIARAKWRPAGKRQQQHE